MYVLRIVRQIAEVPQSRSFEFNVPSIADATDVLSHYRGDPDLISAYLDTAAGTYVGSGIAGRGRFETAWS